MSGYYYFISHAAGERTLALSIYNYLVDAMGIPKEMIFCSSINEQIPFGTNDYLKYIHDAIIGTKAANGKFIALISSAFMQSSFCKYEIGAAWALDIEMKPILFPPISYSDRDIVSSPLSRTQALRIDKNNLDETIHTALLNLLIDGERDSRVSKCISSVSRAKQLESTTEASKAILNLLCSVDVNRVGLDLLAQTGGIYHAQGLSYTMSFERDIDEQQLLLSMDFSRGAPQFAGYYVRPIKPDDWTLFIKNRFFIRFDAYATEGVENIYIELKCRDYQITDKMHRLSPNVWSTYSFYLGNQNEVDGWSTMKEICFVVKPDSLSTERGIVKIKNLRLEREPLV